jgi:NitT/TauT family transport system substrate-binding protein
MRKTTAVIIAAVATVGVVTGCSSSGSGGGGSPAATAGGGGGTAAGKTTSVTVGVIPILDVAPIYLGQKKGFFAKHGLSLTLKTAQGGAAIVPAVVSGQYQFGFSNMTSLILASSKGLPLKVVANGVASTGVQGKDFGGVIVPGNSSIKSAKDLAGKTVAVNTLQNINDTTVRESVRKAGGDPKSVKFVELAFPDMLAALSSHRVDAAQVVEPFKSAGLAQGDRLVASNYVDTADKLTIAAYFATTKEISSKPDMVKSFTDAMNESLTYANSHPDEIRNIVTTYTKITAAQAAKMTLPSWPTEVNKASVQTLADLAKQDGLIKQVPDLDKLLP